MLIANIQVFNLNGEVMKKALAGLACLAVASAVQAQSSVQFTGLADVYVGSMKMAGDASRANKMGTGGMTTSWFGMRGTEDLGSGLKANVAFTGFLRLDTGSQGRFNGDNLFSRDANVSLSGGFGTVLLGRGVAPNFLPSVLFNPLGDSFGFSPLIIHNNVNMGTRFARNNPSDTGWSSQVLYSTPTVGGLRANFHYALAGVAGKKNIGGNLFYSAGPLGLTAYYERDQLNNPNTSVFSDGSTKTVWMLGGSYDATVVKGFATYGESKSSLATTPKQTTFTLGASVPMGPNGKVLAAYANSKPDNGNRRQTLTVGYDHFLSKRTDAYVMLMNDRLSNFSSGTSLGLGVRHRF